MCENVDGGKFDVAFCVEINQNLCCHSQKPEGGFKLETDSATHARVCVWCVLVYGGPKMA